MVRALVFALVMMLRTTAAWADDGNDCLKGAGDIQIRGCSRIIKSRKLDGKPISKRNLATAYTNRGIAYGKKGEVDRAIADYDKAIAVDPKYANAYVNRGLSYHKKGEVDRAIADYTKAIAQIAPDGPSESIPQSSLMIGTGVGEHSEIAVIAV